MLVESQSDESPDGLNWKVVNKSQDKFSSGDSIELVFEIIGLKKIRMRKNEEPKKLFEYIKAVEKAHTTKKKKTQESENIAIVLSQAPKEHQ